MYTYAVRTSLARELATLERKDPKLCEALLKKIDQIVTSSDVNRYKNLRKPLNHLKRVHIKNHVLAFWVHEHHLIFEAFEHHDDVYTQPL